MNTIAHYIPEKNYLGILNSLNKIQDYKSLGVTNLHDKLFDFCYVNKPKNLILPIHEYTKEMHEFVEQYSKQINVFIYFGGVENIAIKQFCETNNIFMLCNKQSPTSNMELCYNHLYDNTIFSNTNNLNRIDKTLIVLSLDNDKNKQLLHEQIYPESNIPLILINNPEFNHPQNIGTAYQSDLAMMFNTYKNLIDIDEEYDLEAQACGIQNLVYNTSVSVTLEQYQTKTITNDLKTCESDYFVSEKLLPVLKG